MHELNKLASILFLDMDGVLIQIQIIANVLI